MKTPPGEDGDFARDIHAGEVVPGVGLGEAEGLGLRDDLAEGSAPGREAVEDVGEGPAEDALDARDLVARFHQVPQRRDHRQPRAHRRLNRQCNNLTKLLLPQQ